MSDVDILKAKLVEWKLRLSGSDLHSIGKQIAQMLWRSAFYRSINESRRFLLNEPNGQKRANGPLHELIDDGYFIANSTAIRRLLDKGDLSGDRGVISLYGLIKDIKGQINIFTRGNVLKARGLEYDFEPIMQQAIENASLEAKAKGGNPAFCFSSDGWAEARYWHGVMDRLCQVAPSNRDPLDKPDQNKLESLLRELEERGRNVKDWVDKFVAHPASLESRKTVPIKHQSLNLKEIWLAERAVVRAANFISLYFVDGMNVGGVPVPQFDQFDNLDQPIIQPSTRPEMRRAWSQHCKEINSCENWFWDQPLADASDVWPDEGESKGD